MKILLTSDPEIPVPPTLYGGIERIIDRLARGLQARGHRVALTAHAASTCSVEKLYAWPSVESGGSLNMASNALALNKAAKEFKPDLVHSFSRLFYLLGILRAPYPKLMSYQRFPTPRTVASAARLSRGSLRFSGCSDFICRQGRAAGGTWQTIPNFIDPDAFAFVPQVSADAPLIFLSRIERIKGAHQAIAIARRAGRRLILAGNHESTGENGRYWTDLIEPEIGHHGIEYVGAVDDRQKNEWLGQAAALVVPIEWDEPFGIVFAEALACGTPVISYARGALPEIIRPGVEGFFIRDIAEGARCVEDLHTISRAACRRRAVEQFSVERALDLYESLYRRLVNKETAA